MRDIQKPPQAGMSSWSQKYSIDPQALILTQGYLSLLYLWDPEPDWQPDEDYISWGTERLDQ